MNQKFFVMFTIFIIIYIFRKLLIYYLKIYIFIIFGTLDFIVKYFMNNEKKNF
jgi:transcriptional antiterminator